MQVRGGASRLNQGAGRRRGAARQYFGSGLPCRFAYQRRSRDRQRAHSRTARLISGIPHRTHNPSSTRRWPTAEAAALFLSRQGRHICRVGARPETRLRAGVPVIGVPHKIQAPVDSRRCSKRRAGCTSRHLCLRKVGVDRQVVGGVRRRQAGRGFSGSRQAAHSNCRSRPAQAAIPRRRQSR